MKRTKDAESLAIDILTFLTGISSRDGEKFPVLRRAIRSVTQSRQRGLLRVIDELRKDGSPVVENIADHIESMTDYDFAHLLFSDGSIRQSISLDKQLNIIQVADLVLPDKDTKFEEYTTMELLSVAMLIVISTFALDFIHTDRSVFKIVDLDEAWSFLNVAQGKTLANKLVRAGRAMNAAVYFVTQNAADLVKNAVADLESQGATSFVLDIRDNPGGFLTQSVDIASLFVKSGTIVKIQTKAEETSKTTSRPYVTEKPLVLLVNGKTSASAEVLAASLKDNQRATLVGSTTLGKGSVQVTRDLSFGGALRYTAAFYKSPLGHDIEGVGVTPDVMVGLAEGEDNQKALALETAQSLVKG
mgnify:CR=1 FL=1